MAGPSTALKIDGTTPGLLDPTQVARILQSSNSKLSFASFDPLTAFGSHVVPDINKLSLKNEDFIRPKRIVVESFQTGESFWRFVPKALMEEGVVEEGIWPKVVDICG
jgi:hypothetical protein